MKFILLFLIITFAAYLSTVECASAVNNSHNVTWGEKSIHDILLKRHVLYKKSKFLRKVEDDFYFDLKGYPYVRTITRVVVTDQYTNGSGGYATLASGGPHFNHVNIHFTSQRSHGFSFIIDIFGQ